MLVGMPFMSYAERVCTPMYSCRLHTDWMPNRSQSCLRPERRATSTVSTAPSPFESAKPPVSAPPFVRIAPRNQASPARKSAYQQSQSQSQPQSQSQSQNNTALLTTLGGGIVVARGRGMTNVTYNSNGRQAVSVGFDGLAHLWDIQTQSEQLVCRGHEKSTWSVAISPDENLLVTGSEDRTLRLWNSKSGSEIARVSANGIFSCVRFSSDGQLVFSEQLGWKGSHLASAGHEPGSRDLTRSTNIGYCDRGESANVCSRYVDGECPALRPPVRAGAENFFGALRNGS